MKTCSACGEAKPLGEFYEHPNGAQGRDSRCKGCSRAKAREYHQANRTHRNAQRRRRVQRNPAAHAATLRKAALKRQYGLSVEQYEAMVAAQGGKCRICNKAPGRVRLAVDHDHGCCPTRGKSCGQCIRGLLCDYCNRQLGWYEQHRPAIDRYLS